MEEQSIWDKISSIATTLIAIATVFIGIWTSRLSDKLENFKTGMDEEKMVSELVTNISTTDTLSNLKSDLTFLSLERYLSRANKNYILNDLDKKMLIGFAESLVLARQQHKTVSASGIKVPYDFLKRTYSKEEFQEFNRTILNTNETTNLPAVIVTDTNFLAQTPIKTAINKDSKEIYSAILRKVVYIQYSNKANKKGVKAVQNILKNNLWIAPGIEFVAGTYSNRIKYFHEEDRDLANQINELLENKYVPLRIYNFETRVPKGQLEVWINNN